MRGPIIRIVFFFMRGGTILTNSIANDPDPYIEVDASRPGLGINPKAQNGPKALHNLVFRPKSLKI